MKRYLLSFFFFIVLSGLAYAHDAADLKALQPLTPDEQSLYEEVKDNAPMLHRFIVTRMYMRTVGQIIKRYNLNEDISKLGKADLDKLPCFPDDATSAYTFSEKEMKHIFQLLLYGCMER